MNSLKMYIYIFHGENYLVTKPNEWSEDSWGVFGIADANP